MCKHKKMRNEELDGQKSVESCVLVCRDCDEIKINDYDEGKWLNVSKIVNFKVTGAVGIVENRMIKNNVSIEQAN